MGISRYVSDGSRPAEIPFLSERGFPGQPSTFAAVMLVTLPRKQTLEQPPMSIGAPRGNEPFRGSEVYANVYFRRCCHVYVGYITSIVVA